MEITTYLLIATGAFYFISVLYLFAGLFRLNHKKNDKIHFCSVIVAVHNEESNLEKCLNSLVNQNYPADSFEVIIADDRSVDSTPQIINRYCQKYPTSNLYL